MFNIGNKVRCINTGGNIHIKEGEIYKVGEVSGPYLYLENSNIPYYITRFELVREEPKMEIGKKYKSIVVQHHIVTCVGITTDGRPIVESAGGKIQPLSHDPEKNWQEYVEPRTGIVTIYIYQNSGGFFSTPFKYDNLTPLATKQVSWTEGDTA